MTYKICIEGIDGAGKTTQIRKLKAYLENHGYSVGLADFPRYETFVGKEIGSFLNTSNPVNVGNMDIKSVCLWYATDRLVHFRENPALFQENNFLLMNRYTLSNMTFQSARSDKPEEISLWIYQLEHQILGIPEPDLYIILDVDPNVARLWKERQLKNETRSYSECVDAYEENIDLQTRTALRYRHFAQIMPNVTIIHCYDEQGQVYPADVIFEKILAELRKYSALPKKSIYTYSDVEKMDDATTLALVQDIMGNHDKDYLHDMNACQEVAAHFKISVVAQSDEEHGVSWLAVDLNRVVYGDNIELDTKAEYRHENMATAICKCAIVSYYGVEN